MLLLTDKLVKRCALPQELLSPTRWNNVAFAAARPSVAGAVAWGYGSGMSTSSSQAVRNASAIFSPLGNDQWETGEDV